MNVTADEQSNMGSMAAWLMNAEGRLNWTEQQSLGMILLSLMSVDLSRHLYPREGEVKERVFDRVVSLYEKLVEAEMEEAAAPSGGDEEERTKEDRLGAEMTANSAELNRLLLDTAALEDTVSQRSVAEYLREQVGWTG